MLKKITFLLLIALTFTLLTGCTAAPPSSNPSSDMPTSTLPSSSTPELPPLNLSIPMNGEAMLSTLSAAGYIDQNGVFHYSKALAAWYQKNWASVKKDTQNFPDGSANAKAIYSIGDSQCYVLTDDGRIKIVSEYKLDEEIFFSDGEPSLPEDPFYRESLSVRNADVLCLDYASDWTTRLKPFIAFDFQSDRGAVIVGCSKDLEEYTDVSKTDHIVQYSHTPYLQAYLYTDGTIALTEKTAKQFSVGAFAGWKDLVQMGVGDKRIVGLKKDGTLLYALTKDGKEIPAKYCTNVVRLFTSGNCFAMQQYDGTVVIDMGEGNFTNLGTFQKMDQIICFGDYVIGVDTTGKVQLLSGRRPPVSGSFPYNDGDIAAWALTLTDVKTVWNN